jgi:long-chain acyl-CoA synthetase
VQQLQELIDKKEPVKPSKRLAQWPRTFIAGAVRFVLQELFFLWSRLFLHIKVTGAQHLGSGKGVMLMMPNHLSNWDGVVVARIMPLRVRWRLSFAAALDVVYGEYKYLSWLSELSFNCFPLPRQEGSQIKVGLENAGQMLDMGYHVVVFPEGKISKDGSLLLFKDGAGLLATQMGVSVVPIRIRNIEKIFPYDTFLPRSWGTVQVTIGKPMKFSRLDNYQEVTQRIRHIFDLM